MTLAFSRGEWVLIDGDKIAALCADFIHAEMVNLGLDKVRVFPSRNTPHGIAGERQRCECVCEMYPALYEMYFCVRSISIYIHCCVVIL